MRFLQTVRKKTFDLRYSIMYSKKLPFIIVRPFYLAAHLLILGFPGMQYSIITHLKYRKHLHQWGNSTFTNRYPELFAICKEFFKKRENVKILSFGCSTGEEVYSIHSYLPEAIIIGADINPYNLRQCRKSKPHKNISFMHSLSEEYRQSGDFDAIFCLAVLLNVKNRKETNIATKFTFQQFEKQLSELDEKLKSGGLLFIDRTDFNFMETAISGKYSPLEAEGSRTIVDRPLFNSNNIKISEKNDCYKVFLKNK
jgi:hypothetical protein